MRLPWWWRGSVVTAGSAAALVVLVFAWASLRAVTIGPVRQAEPHGIPPSMHTDSAVPARMPADAVRQAAAVAPFRSDRRPPPARFALPGERVAVAISSPAVPAFELAGTVVYPDGGGTALVRVAGRGSIVRVGETIEGLTLRSVEPETAVFARPNGQTVVFRVSKAGS